MQLEQIFYILSIAFFFSFWILIAVVIVFLLSLYRNYSNWKKNFWHGKTFLSGLLTITTLAGPLIKKLTNKRR